MRINYLFYLVLLFVFFSSCSHQAINSAKTTSTKIKVFLFAGQSNMDGRANAAQISESDLQRLEKVKDRIEFYYNRQLVSPLKVSTPSAYIQRKFSLEKCFGPELFFGIELAEKYPDQKFIFIKRAKGGTSLYGCWNPEWTEEKATLMNELNKPKLFEDFIDYTKEVLTRYNPDTYEISAMLWVQGEADSSVKKWGSEPSKNYGKNLQKLIGKVRLEFQEPALPFIMFQVGSGRVVEGMKATATQDEQVFLIPQSKNKNALDFYEKNPPPIGHYTAKSMKRIGEQFFEVYNSKDQ